MSNGGDDRKEGLHGKFFVQRVDGSSAPGKKHENCFYFVLDLQHDKFAKVALAAYASACEDEYPLLAADLLEKVDAIAEPPPVKLLLERIRKEFPEEGIEPWVDNPDCGWWRFISDKGDHVDFTFLDEVFHIRGSTTHVVSDPELAARIIIQIMREA